MSEVKEVYRLKNANDDTVGLDAALTLENGRLMFDFKKPIQYLELEDIDVQRLITSLVLAGFEAFGKDAKKAGPLN